MRYLFDGRFHEVISASGGSERMGKTSDVIQSCSQRMLLLLRIFLSDDGVHVFSNHSDTRHDGNMIHFMHEKNNNRYLEC
jgi:hypothetical protein